MVPVVAASQKVETERGLQHRHTRALWETQQDPSPNLEHVGKQTLQEGIIELIPPSNIELGTRMDWPASQKRGHLQKEGGKFRVMGK